MAVIVHTYGARAHWARDLPAEVDTQLWLAHRLREDLVEVTRRRQVAVAAIWSAHPRIAELETRIAQLDTLRGELRDRAAKVRSAARSRTAEHRETSAELKRVNADLRQAKADRRTAIAAVRAQVDDQVKAAYDAEKAETKALYGVYCQDGIVDRDGVVQRLYWATWNDVAAHHRTAVQRLAAARAAGRPADLRHHRYDGTGAISVQLQRGAAQPPRTPELIGSGGGPWRNVLTLPAEPGRGHARMRVGDGHQTIPITMHQGLPPDADITGARLVVRRVAGQRRAALQVTARVPDPPTRIGGPTVAVHLGWRHVGDGAVQVATWRATDPIPVPEQLRELVTRDSERSGTVVLPGAWRAAVARADEIRGGRDRDLDVLRAELVAHLTEHPPGDGEEGWPTAAEVTRWRSPARFAALARRHRDQPGARADIVGVLEAWRRVDRRLWETEAHGRDKLAGRRADRYACVAAWLATQAGRVVVDDTDLTRLATRPAPGTADVPTAVERAAAAQRVAAAVGSLRERVITTCRREGVEITEVSHQGVTRTHSACGHTNPADHDYTGRLVDCLGCGRHYDQDRSAVANMLAASGAIPPAGQGTARETA